MLREGPDSPYARWFDVDWAAGGGKVLLPVLGGPLGGELEHLAVDGEVLRYHDHAFPLRDGTAGLPLPELLDAQHYRLGWWRLARTELNYRRFFTVPELIGVRVEHPEVFEDTHAKILELLRDGVLDGLRIDHPDGLAAPAAYLERLHEATGGRWTVVEKILTGDEHLPAEWAVAGTTGYDALRRIDGLFTDPAGAAELLGHYREFAIPPADRGGDWTETARRAAYRVVTHELASETAWLTRLASAVCERDPALRDHAPLGPADGGPGAAGTGPGLPAVRHGGRAAEPYGTGGAARRCGAGREGGVRRGGGGGGRGRRTGAGARAARRRPRTDGVQRPVRPDGVRAARQVGGGHGVLPVRAAALGHRGGRRRRTTRRVAGRVPRVRGPHRP